MKKDFSTARAAIGGIKGVMRKLGDDPQHEHKWKSMPKCPFCLNKDCAGVFTKGGTDYFKCHKPGCCSGNAVVAEVGYIALKEGLSEDKPVNGGASPAYRRFLELAGCWEEPKPPVPKPSKPAEPVRHNPAVPIAPPVLPNPVIPPSAPTPEEIPDKDMILRCIEVIRFEQKASVSLLQRKLKIGYTRASRLMDDLEKMGVVGPVNGMDPRIILKLPERPEGSMVVNLEGELHIEIPKAAEPTPIAEKSKPEIKPEEKPKLPLGLAALRAFKEKLFPTESQMVAFIEKPFYFCEPCNHIMEGATCKKCDCATRLIDKVPNPLPGPIAKKLKFKAVPMIETRRITSKSCAALGLCANPGSNEALLRDLDEIFSWEELRASGLFLEADKKRKLGRRPNAQFHGKGQLGRKPDKERKGKDDKWAWGFCDPVLIPYFDEAGELIKLRPHKGGAPAGTIAGRPRIYVPRDYRKCADVVEEFYTVVICEGEFKAIAIWQTVGLGRVLQTSTPDKFEPVGVCGLPGISYVTNVEMRMDLERWLGEVKARRVLVAFDDEDKSDKPLRQRFDALRDARVLAIELSQILHVDARVIVLPREWRNDHGKADWDGALVKLIDQKQIIKT